MKLNDLTQEEIDGMKDAEINQIEVDVGMLPFGTRARFFARQEQEEMFAEEEMGEQVSLNVFLDEHRRMEELTKKRITHALAFFEAMENMPHIEDKDTADSVLAELARSHYAIISKL